MNVLEQATQLPFSDWDYVEHTASAVDSYTTEACIYAYVGDTKVLATGMYVHGELVEIMDMEAEYEA